LKQKKGSGENPKATDMVKVNYTGKLFDGKVFDTNNEAEAKKANVYNKERKYEPIEFPLNRVIPGWIEGLQLMKKGGKAKLIIPSAIAYGPQGQGSIPPYASLVFEVELIDFKPAPPEQQGPPQGQVQQQGQQQRPH